MITKEREAEIREELSAELRYHPLPWTQREYRTVDARGNTAFSSCDCDRTGESQWGHDGLQTVHDLVTILDAERAAHAETARERDAALLSSRLFSDFLRRTDAGGEVKTSKCMPGGMLQDARAAHRVIWLVDGSEYVYLPPRDAAPVSREAAYALVEGEMRELGARRAVLWPGDDSEVTVTTRDDTSTHASLLAAVDALKAGRT